MNQTLGDRPILLEPNSQHSDDFSLSQMVDLIADTFGIHIKPHYQDRLKKNLLTRIQALGLCSLNDYYQFLVARNQLVPGATEWRELISLLTVTETYFFRDQGQMSLLKNQLLPELIERKRELSLTQCNAGNGELYRPTLRLWSAGCSTGEEAYSLAILVKELIPDNQIWDILILGTDINQRAIALARQGIYSDWSFRTTTEEIKNRYFQSHKKGWKIDPAIQAMVTFQPGNLMQDNFPAYASSIHDFDLIICRNVFIYFDFNAIAQVISKFYCSLTPGGFLLTGHTELHGQTTEPFQVKNFPQSAVYQRHSSLKEQSKVLNTITPAAIESRETEISYPSLNPVWLTNLSVEACRERREAGEEKLFKSNNSLPSLETGFDVSANTQTLLDAAKESLIQEAYADVIQLAQQLIALVPQHFQAYCLMAEAYANFGDYSQASQACQQALQISPLAIEPYHLLAQIAEEQGDRDSAKLFLKRIIYLAPNSVTAHLELGFIYEREGNEKQAQKTWRSLLEILQNLPQEAIDSHSQQTTAELKAHVLKHLNSTSYEP
ncbi:MAG: CheR family methyltransferase [Nostoc sp. DedVER02]|uniref:CheR family methyltransferase n=1 Tax=unclassified Nostoc TaxID=2593658 RepID=UPI002AD2B866|nr:MULTISPECIES: CheR family methyltransferase [unclassified Nostoc]MDZ7988944.1 CheR family methyltransferase [Nostoc sp. DedVER02]MDZ8114738.1 CheR family methyltransferase [Nostoc sp. DedVER01b]